MKDDVRHHCVSLVDDHLNQYGQLKKISELQFVLHWRTLQTLCR